ncbi:ABC transporter substrate-binding protein [Chloroflexota bacterium]
MTRHHPVVHVVLSLLVLMMISFACTAPGARQPVLEPVTLRVVTLPRISYAPFYIAQEEGFFAEQALEIEFVEMKRSSEAIPALAQGDLDVVGGALSVGLLNAIAREARIKLVADKGHTASSGCSSSVLIARRELVEGGQLEDPAQLKGLRVSLNPAGFTGYYVEKLIAPFGLGLDDLEILKHPAAVELEALAEGAIDIIATSEPWVTHILQGGYGVIWLPVQDIVPGSQQSLLWYGPSLLDENPEAGKRFMVAYLKAVRQYNEGKTERNLEIMTNATELERELLIEACWPRLRDDGGINAESVLDFQSWAVDEGLLDIPITEDQFWDPGFVEHANQALSSGD